MKDRRTWLITGAGRGMGVNIARAALAAGHAVVGFFRTDLLENTSTTWPEPSIADYAERTGQTVAAWHGMNGKQGGDPVKLATALVQLADLDEPPARWAAGADAVAAVEEKARTMLAQVDAYRALPSALGHDDVTAG